jgi:hypothetical protein
MIWIACSLFISTILLCCTLICIKFSDRAYTNAIACLQDLCDILNDKFPGSDLRIVADGNGVKVKGELKYIKRDGD